VAAAALALCVAVFAAAKSLEAGRPWLGFVAAFAEAATIGGLADWYAVVALFRRPLGLPIPHTAIIPENQERIADNLGRFIEVNFLAPGPVREKLEEVDFSALVADWLADRSRAEGLSRFVVRLVPQALSAIGQSGLRDFISARMLEQLDKCSGAAGPSADRLHRRPPHQNFRPLIRVLGRFLKTAAWSARAKIQDNCHAFQPFPTHFSKIVPRPPRKRRRTAHPGRVARFEMLHRWAKTSSLYRGRDERSL